MLGQKYPDFGPGIFRLFLAVALRVDEILEAVPGTVILVKFMVHAGGGERGEDGVGAPTPAVFGAEHATRDEDDVGVVRYEQEPQEDQLVVQIALRAVGSRAAVRGDEK